MFSCAWLAPSDLPRAWTGYNAMGKHARAIVWAQWRTLRNYLPRSNKAGAIFTGLLTTVWYGSFAFLAWMSAIVLARTDQVEFIRGVLPSALFMCFLYWQVIPILMASMGSSLDIKKLLVYPIPKGELYALEVLLRVSTGIEMLLLLTGAGIGLLLNPVIPFWAPATLVGFVIFNLLFSAGIRDLLVRLMARKRVREIVIFLFVLAAALPQFILRTGSNTWLRRLFDGEPSPFWPWTATARLAQGHFSWTSLGAVTGWILAAYVFGRWQFEQGLKFDAREAASKGASPGRRASRLEWWYRFPNSLFRDPLAALIEKELRSLSRTPRFRLVFLMGFSFGLLIWAPMAFGRGISDHSLITENYLTFVSVYALLLLSDALFWNCFGFDRSAVQVYFVAPVKMSTVLIGKNLAAIAWVLLEITAIAVVCALLRLPMSGLQILEAVAVTCVVTLLILSIGNLSSFYNPRPVNPVKSFRTAASGRTQAMLMLAFPISLIPVALAYIARYAFYTEWAFFGVLFFGALVGGIIYSYSMGLALKAAEERKERFLTALSRGDGPIES
jgi:ABC-2 type transport system permease protein